jgi:hypothetical protein
VLSEGTTGDPAHQYALAIRASANQAEQPVRAC